jgi:hypothetical protein
VVAETGRNRNEILMLSIDFALENMEIVKEWGGLQNGKICDSIVTINIEVRR